MFWGVSEAWWMQIWSGVLGASVAAGISILVALIVVKKTNEHQSVLSNRALSEQRKRDDKALAEQRARDEAALEVQREALREQMEHQRAETARLRMMDIRADVVADANHITDAAMLSREAVDQAMPALSRSITRWRIESPDEDLVDELMQWPRFIGLLARQYRLAMELKHVSEKERDLAFSRLNNAVSLLSVVGIHLPRDDRIPPEAVHRVLRHMREAIEKGGSGDSVPLPTGNGS